MKRSTVAVVIKWRSGKVTVEADICFASGNFYLLNFSRKANFDKSTSLVVNFSADCFTGACYLVATSNHYLKPKVF